MHFVHTVCNHFIIYIKFNMSMDEVNEVSQISHFSVFLLWIALFKQLSGKAANKFHQLQVYKFVYLNLCWYLLCIYWYVFSLFKDCLNKQWSPKGRGGSKCQRKKSNL